MKKKLSAKRLVQKSYTLSKKISLLSEGLYNNLKILESYEFDSIHKKTKSTKLKTTKLKSRKKKGMLITSEANQLSKQLTPQK